MEDNAQTSTNVKPIARPGIEVKRPYMPISLCYRDKNREYGQH
jgi:hypothetical protein